MAFCLAALGLVAPARAADPPPGFLEPIVHWGVQKGETCEDIARVMYGATEHVVLINRYNRVSCVAGQPLPEGTTLILPAAVTTVPDAQVKSSHPDVRGRPPGAEWAPVASGTPLYRNHNVQTLEDGRAHIEFIDRSHVFIAEHTLIVIYGTASKTRVSKTPPMVELSAGEVQAGLSALRGEPAEVAVPDGGSVRAESRDTVVERKGNRSTVAVFDGKAHVRSGGKAVVVPTNFGTRFVGAAPPAQPRPLPKAPAWEAGGSPEVVLASGGEGRIAASWSEVPKAKAYRVEVARDEAFHDLVVREEVRADVRSFRAEKMPPGTYRVRVRAIDTEEYLGIAAVARSIEILGAEVRGEGSKIDDAVIVVNPYGTLSFAPTSSVEVAIDDGPFGPAPGEIDLLKQKPKVMRVRTRTAAQAQDVLLQYAKVAATVKLAPDATRRALDVRATLAGLGGIDVSARVSPTARAHLAGRVQALPLVAGADGAFVASVPLGDATGRVRVDLVDGRGVVLGTAEVVLPERPAPPPSPPPSARPLGPTLSPWQPSLVADVMWWSPTAPDTVAIGVAGGGRGQGGVFAGQVRASGSIGRLGLDGVLPTVAAGAADAAELSAWLGVRYRALRLRASALEVGPALRLGLPLDMDAGASRLEAALAMGGAHGAWTWLGNLGGRVRLVGSRDVPRVQPYLLLGATYDPLAWLRVHGFVDGHLLLHAGDVRVAGRGGLSMGLEAGGTVFVALAGRVGLLEAGSGFSGLASLSLGVRDTKGAR